MCKDWGQSLSISIDLFNISYYAQLIEFPLSQGTAGSRWELSHLSGLSGVGGIVFGSVIL